MAFPRLTSSIQSSHPLWCVFNSLIWYDIADLGVVYNANPTQFDQIGRRIFYLETIKGLNKLLKVHIF